MNEKNEENGMPTGIPRQRSGRCRHYKQVRSRRPSANGQPPSPAHQSAPRIVKAFAPSLLLLTALSVPLRVCADIPTNAGAGAGKTQADASKAPAQTPAGQTGTPAQNAPLTPAQLPIPVTTPIPTAAPPTGLQAPLPTPAGTNPRPDKPTLVSPGLGQLTGRVPPQPLNINDAVAIALINNRQLALSTSALLRAQGRLSETRAAFNPIVNSSFTYTRLSQGQSVNLGGGAVGGSGTTTGAGGTTTTGGTGTTGTTTTGTEPTGTTGGTGVQTGGTGSTTGTTTGTTGTTTGTTGTTTGGTTTTTGGTTTTTGGTSGGTTTVGGQNINIVNVDQPVLSASIALPVDIAGLLREAVRQAQFLEVAQRIDINRTRNQIVLDTKSAFYNVLRQQALVVVAQDTLRNSQDRLLDAQRKFAAGTVARFDVIRALTDVQNARQQLIVAQTGVDNALGQLNNNLGLNIDTPLSLTSQDAVFDPPGVAPPTIAANAGGLTGQINAAPTDAIPANPITPPEGPDNTPLPPSAGTIGATRAIVIVSPSNVLGPEYRAVVQEALVNRPEILEADAQIAAARRGIYLARRSQLPALNLSVGVQYSPNAAGFSPQTSTETFVAGLSFPLYDGGVSGARVTQARADVATAQTNRRQAVDEVNLDVRNAYLSLLQSRDRVAVANQALAEAVESFRLSRVRYTNGVSTLVEVSDAQNALTQAQNNQVNALYDYNNSRASLDKAAGRYAYLGNAPGFPAPPPAKVTGSAPQGGH